MVSWPQRCGKDDDDQNAHYLADRIAVIKALGMLLGSIGLRPRDVFFASNLMYFLTLLFCGTNVPLEALPGWMQSIGRSLPLTHGIEAARDVAGGAAFGEVSGLV
jgi:ABC-2 type transport system permease protein